MASKIGIHIRGAEEFQRAIAYLIRNTESILLGLATEQAASLTIEAASSMIPIVTGAAANSMTVIAEKTSAAISSDVPYFGILNFGGESGIGGSNIREYIAEGRYIYPAFKSQLGVVEFEINSALRAIVKASGLDLK